MRGTSLIRSGADERALWYCELRKRNSSFSLRLFFSQISIPVGIVPRILWSSKAKFSCATADESLCMEIVHPMSTPTWSGLRYAPILYAVPTLQELPAWTSGICTILTPSKAGWSHCSLTHSKAASSMFSVNISADVYCPVTVI